MEGVRDELNARDVIIARLEAEPNNLIPGLKENNEAIANLELKLSGVITELKDQETLITELGDELSKANLKLEAKDRAITAIKSGLAVKGGDKQLNLFPPELTPIQTPEPEPIPTPEPTPTPEPKSKVKSKPKTTPEPEPEPIPLILLDSIEGTVPRKVIMDRILKIDPATEINGQIITDAVLGKNQRLSELENLYGFNIAGYVMKGQKREYRYTIN